MTSNFLLIRTTLAFCATSIALFSSCNDGLGPSEQYQARGSSLSFGLEPTLALGDAIESTTTWVSAFICREDLGQPDVPDRIFDMRTGWQVSMPSQLVFEFPATTRTRFLSTAVMPTLGQDATAHCEVFWQDSSDQPQSIFSTQTQGNQGWQEMLAPLPQTAGKLICITRAVNQQTISSEQRVGWALPLVAEKEFVSASTKPDVLLLSVDTLRSDALAHMPLLSARLKMGAIWHQAISPSNWTLPSYASLFSALPATQHGAGRGAFAPVENKVNNKKYRAIHDGIPLLSEAFQRAGYFTSLVYQNPFLEKWTGLHRGFHRSIRIRDRTALTIKASKNIWQQTPDRPRFLVAQFIAPHHPYAPIGVLGLPDDPIAELDLPPFIDSDATPDQRAAFFDLDIHAQQNVRTLYYAECRELDKQLDPWLTELANGPRPLLIAFHSDHGEELWDEGSFEHGHSFADSVIRVPIALLWPGHVPVSSSSKAVPAWALGPTMLQLAGIALPSEWDLNLFEPASLPAEVPCTGTLYRARRGGRIFHPDGTTIDLPFRGLGTTGPEADLGEDGAQFLEQLGY